MVLDWATVVLDAVSLVLDWAPMLWEVVASLLLDWVSRDLELVICAMCASRVREEALEREEEEATARAGGCWLGAGEGGGGREGGRGEGGEGGGVVAFWDKLHVPHLPWWRGDFAWSSPRLW